MLVSLAVGLAIVSSWQGGAPRDEWRILPVSLVILVILYSVYVWSRAAEMAELRGLVRGLEQRASIAPDLDQLERLFGLVQRSQQGYRDLIDTFDDLLFSVSLEGQILAANRRFAEVLGRSFHDLVGKALEDFVELPGGMTREAAEKAVRRIVERRHWSGMLRIRLKETGEVRFYECSVHALCRNGECHGLGVLARDITQQRENETRFTELFETLQEGVYAASGDGRLTDVNPALARMLGYEGAHALFDRPLGEAFEKAEEWEAQRRELDSTGMVRGREVVLRRQDGSGIVCLHNAALIRDARGRPTRLQGTFIDITERRAFEERLHREQEFARRLIECFPDLVLVLDSDWRCTFVSPRSKELLGFAPEELAGTRLTERLDLRDRAELTAKFEAIRTSAADASACIDVLIENRGGEMRLFRTTASSLLNQAGEPQEMIVSMRDITESKRIEQQLIQSERLAAMGQMIAGVAHELNNPLTAVIGVTEMLRDAEHQDSERRHLELAHSQARRAAQIVQSLLSFARPPHPRKTRLYLDDVIERSLQFHERSLRASNIRVDFAAKGETAAVLGDASQLTQVFLNLITNAEQAIRECRDHGTIRIRVATLGERVVATIQDDGAGIRRDILPKIFDPFFTTKRPGRGTGLGLSISLAIIREHNGGIECQPLPDGGTTFTVWLPVAKGTELVMTEPAALRSAAGNASSLAGCTILAVDDEECIREMIRDGLATRGVRVDLASSGEEALCLIESRAYDAVLCDLNLKSMAPTALSGEEFVARAQRLITAGRPNHKPVFIFMTGDLAEAGPAGVPRMQKPFRISELAALLTELLAGTEADPRPVKSS